MHEYAFDGIVGPTHHYAGLSRGNLASFEHAGEPGNPRAAALAGLEKMRTVAELSSSQAVLPPHERPYLPFLRGLGFGGSDAEVLDRAYRTAPVLLSTASSASSMWTANAASVTGSPDTRDGRVHFTPANLQSMLHRSLEASLTTRMLRRIFADPAHFAVHAPLPSHSVFSDEGAANHIRLSTDTGTINLFGWGRAAHSLNAPTRYPARQTREASQAVLRLNALKEDRALLWQQDPEGIDAGAFHTDVLAVGGNTFFMLHERAFLDRTELIDTLRARLGEQLCVVLASEAELPVADAVAAYPFNSQLVLKDDGRVILIAPAESQANPAARDFFDRLVAVDTPVSQVRYVDVNASMRNGGGPACLRLRVPLTNEERGAVTTNVFLDAALERTLEAWIQRHYRDRLTADELRDPLFLVETREALDELTVLLGLGSIYEFQGASAAT